MRRIIIVALSVALLTTTAWVVRGAAAGSTAQSTRSAAATLRDQSGPRKALYQAQLEQNLQHHHPAGHQHPAAAPNGSRSQVLASQLARARLATAKYATNLRAAKADGYQIITQMIPDMGYHYLNPTIQGFDITSPHPGLRAPQTQLAARGAGVGLHRAAGHPAAARRDLWVVRRGVPLQGRDVRGRYVPGSMRQAQPPDRRRL
jgi:hypothetical protein